MAEFNVIEENPVSLTHLKEQLDILDKEKALTFRGEKTKSYLENFIVEKNKDSYKIIQSSLIETSPKKKNGKRLFEIGQSIQKIISKHKPDIIAVEKLFFTKNQKTALQVSEAKGVVLYIAEINKIPCFEFTPLEVKMAVCGYGKADKKQVWEMLKNTFKSQDIPKQDDTADAIAVSLTYFFTKRYNDLKK